MNFIICSSQQWSNLWCKNSRSAISYVLFHYILLRFVWVLMPLKKKTQFAQKHCFNFQNQTNLIGYWELRVWEILYISRYRHVSIGCWYSLHPYIFILESAHFVCSDVSSVVHVFSCTLKLSLKVTCLVILKGALYSKADNWKKSCNLFKESLKLRFCLARGAIAISCVAEGRQVCTGRSGCVMHIDSYQQAGLILSQLVGRSKEIICMLWWSSLSFLLRLWSGRPSRFEMRSIIVWKVSADIPLWTCSHLQHLTHHLLEHFQFFSHQFQKLFKLLFFFCLF